jgi:hypothetical protein
MMKQGTTRFVVEVVMVAFGLQMKVTIIEIQLEGSTGNSATSDANFETRLFYSSRRKCKARKRIEKVEWASPKLVGKSFLS